MSKKFDAGVRGVQGYLLELADYVPLDTDLLGLFQVTGQDGVPREEWQPQWQPNLHRTWSAVWSGSSPDLEFLQRSVANGIEDSPR